MTNQDQKSFWRVLPKYLLCYIIWLGLCALGFWILLQLRVVFFDIAHLLGLNPWEVRAADKLIMLIFGFFGVGTVVLLEHYLRTGVEKGLLWSRSLRALLLEASILGLSYGAQWLIE
ncbi:MAG: hypothetical protein PVG14_00090 [Anaerolineales bacterium]|jgi:hypothetical protein